MITHRRLVMGAAAGAVAVVVFGAAARGAFSTSPASTAPQTQQTEPEQARGITVSGEGKVQGKPDIAQLALGVSVLRATVAAARDQAAASLTAIDNAMKADGIADRDIQTSDLTISPEYNYSDGKQTLTGFRVTNTATVKVRDINTTSKVVDDAVNAGGDDTQIQGITFTIDKPGDLQRQAREAAVADAKAKAQTLASASGVGLGSAIAISEGGGVQPIVYDKAAFAAAPGATTAATPIQPGELDVTVNVSITWAIT
ncbi:MAG: SIMPL domain-containing protein [Dehalococcoidia bacterium]|nr:SIMPL domain-containing protein [Dehalococcoidia bacterium]